MKKNMNISKIEKVKLLYLFNQDNEKVETVLKFRKLLTAYGFEMYVKYFFEKIQGYKTKLTNGNKIYKDGGIDIKGVKGKRGSEIFLIIQCKKWSGKFKIEINEIRSFYGAIVDIKMSNNVKIYYITTSENITRDVYDFAEEKGIIVKDYKNIVEMNNLYSIEQFKEDVKKDDLKIDEIFEYEQLSLISIIENNYINSQKDITEETKDLLKTIRRKIAIENQIMLFDVCKNNTIEILAKRRPQNLEALKIVLEKESIDFRERKKLEKYGNEFIKGLALIEI